MDRPQDMEGTMGGGTRTSTLAQSKTATNTPPSQSSCPSFPGEPYDLVVPPDARILRPRSLEDIDDVIEELKAEFDRHTLDTHTPRPSQYIWALNIPQRLFAQIETDLELFPGVRVTVAHAKSSVLLKVMPGRQHERIICNFRGIVLGCLNSMGLYLQNGDFTGQGAERTPGVVTSKEPNWAFGPYDARVDSAADEYPSLVLEVGVTESLDQLRQDAHWWYANTNQETKLVILIDVTTDDPYRVNFEVWTEVVNQPTAHSTRNHPTTVLQCTQRASLQNGVVTGAPLILDFTTLMHRAPLVVVGPIKYLSQLPNDNVTLQIDHDSNKKTKLAVELYYSNKLVPSKLRQKFVGKFRVLERVGRVAYKLDLPDSWLQKRIHPVIGVAHLEPAPHGDDPWGTQPADTHEPTFDKRFPNDADRYDVERILAKEIRPARGRPRAEGSRGTTTWYLVRWAGQSAKEDQWIPDSETKGCRELVDEFERGNNAPEA
ncbi:hypothetical protein HAV15_012003 [Penicillium sp. str. |nr:hypothetical protein HAV15_012003 [Penicillium sp. str. \